MLFSIITVSFNSSETIERTIKSILIQSFQDYEYIIIDGASTDGTTDIIKRYESSFGDKLHWKSEPDTGTYNAMNKGIKMAKGKLIGIVNSDDWFERDALYTVKNRLIISELDNPIVCGWINFHYANGKSQVLKSSYNRLLKMGLKIKMGVRHASAFVPLAVYKKVGYFDEELKIMADTEFILRCQKFEMNFIFTDQVLSNMTDGGISNSYKGTRQQMKDYFKIASRYSDSYYERYKNICREAFLIMIKLILPVKYILWYRKLM